MKNKIALLYLLFFLIDSSFGQDKILIGIMPFKNPAVNNNSYYTKNTNDDEYTTSIQDVVTNAFLKSKRFSLVEREKMSQLKSEKELQKSEDFIDGSVVEQSKTLGAQYVVLGNISEASLTSKTINVYMVGNVTTITAKVSFSIKIVDVATAQIIASNNFTKSSKGKNGFNDALDELNPEIESFIKENFKIMVSIAEIEEKNKKGEAVKVLIAAGISTGVKKSDEYKVFENTEIIIDGKVLIRKKTIGKIIVNAVEDENFSKCIVKEGGKDIADKMATGKLKCELITQ